MKLKYNVELRKNPNHPAKPGKFYARQVSSGVISHNTFLASLSRKSGISEADLIRVQIHIAEHLGNYLSAGNIVRLQGIGSFRLTYGSKGFDSEKEVQPKTVTVKNIHFSPDSYLKEKATRNITFERNKKADPD